MALLLNGAKSMPIESYTITHDPPKQVKKKRRHGYINEYDPKSKGRSNYQDTYDL